MKIFIKRDQWNDIVEIFVRDGKYILHSQMPDGLATADRIEEGCAIPPEKDKPLIRISANIFREIEKELYIPMQEKYEHRLQQLEGELRAKEQHIENLNSIFEKTLNKI